MTFQKVFSQRKRSNSCNNMISLDFNYKTDSSIFCHGSVPYDQKIVILIRQVTMNYGWIFFASVIKGKRLLSCSSVVCFEIISV